MINILFIFFIYFYFVKKIIAFFKKKINRNYLTITLLLLFYIIGVGTIFSKYEGERFFYSGYIIIILFLIEFFSKDNYLEKTLKKTTLSTLKS